MNDIREDLKAFIDGELPEARMREVEAAIAADSGLQREVQLMRSIGQEIRQMAANPEILGATETLSRLRKRTFSFLWPAATAVSAVALVAIGWPLFAKPDERAKNIVAMSANPAREPVSTLLREKARQPVIENEATATNKAKVTSKAPFPATAAPVTTSPMAANPPNKWYRPSPKSSSPNRKQPQSHGELKVTPGSPDPSKLDVNRNVQIKAKPRSVDGVATGIAFGFASQKEMTVAVASVENSRRRAGEIATLAEGTVATETDGVPNGYVTLRVPASKVKDVTAKLQALSKEEPKPADGGANGPTQDRLKQTKSEAKTENTAGGIATGAGAVPRAAVSYQDTRVALAKKPEKKQGKDGTMVEIKVRFVPRAVAASKAAPQKKP